MVMNAQDKPPTKPENVLRTAFHFMGDDGCDHIIFLTDEEVLQMLALPEGKRYKYLMNHKSREEVLRVWVISDGDMEDEYWEQMACDAGNCGCVINREE